MRRALVPATAAALIAGLGGSAVALSAPGAPAHMHMHMHMSVSAAASGPTAVRLHRKVVRIPIQNFKFSPARVVVSRGTRIVWTNKDSDAHTISSKSARWASKALNTGRSYTQTVRRKGTIRYICSIHPFMHGTVIVK